MICIDTQSCDGAYIILNDTINSTIECWNVNACNNLYIKTNNWETTKLIVKEYSFNITYDNGFGINTIKNNISNFINIDCNINNHYIKFDLNNENTGLNNLIENKYNSNKAPCDGLKVKCVNGECIMNRNNDIFESQSESLLSQYGNNKCFYADIGDIISYSCDGACANSPTLNPTMKPTQQPTIITISPTFQPTFNPTKSPTPSPTHSPTPSPSNSPTFSPSPAPTVSPTSSPSISPTPSPTVPPTNSPTPSPSRYPTTNRAFYGYLNPNFILGNLTDSLIIELYNNVNIYVNTINFIIEESIYNTIINNYGENLVYDDFNVNIKKFNDININDNKLIQFIPRNNIINLNTNITCNRDIQALTCRLILQILQRNRETFVDSTQFKLNNEYDNSLYFDLTQNEASLLEIQEWKPEKEADTFIVLISVFGGLILCLTLIAFLYNKNICFRCSKKCYQTDNAKWISIIEYGFQCYDFFSDIYFTYNMFIINGKYQSTLNDYNDNIIDELSEPIENIQTKALISLVLGIGCVIFTIFPYILNLYYAARIKNNKIIKANKVATNYFNNNAAIFIILTVFSGGVYPSLVVISSMIFGLELFHTGLTKYELNKLTKIKLVTTIACENLPQLSLQLIYFVVFSFESNNARDSAIFAFVGSILSVIISVLIWYINRKENALHAVIYYIQLSKLKNTSLNKQEKSAFEGKKMIHDSILTELCGNIPSIEKSILQISYIKRIECGIQIRFIHFVNDKDLLKMQKSLKRTSDDYNDNFNDMFIGLSPKYYTKKVFNQNKLEMLKMYYTHFELHSINSINYYDLIYYNEDELPNNIDPTIKTTTNLFNHYQNNRHGNENIIADNTELENELELLRQDNAMYQKLFQDMNKSFQGMNKSFKSFNMMDKKRLINNENDQKDDGKQLSSFQNETNNTASELIETSTDNERLNTTIEIQTIKPTKQENTPLIKGESVHV